MGLVVDFKFDIGDKVFFIHGSKVQTNIVDEVTYKKTISDKYHRVVKTKVMYRLQEPITNTIVALEESRLFESKEALLASL